MKITSNILQAFPAHNGQATALAAQRGIAKADAWLDHCRDGLPITMGSPYLISEVGLKMADGQQATKEGITECVSNIAKMSENLNLLKATITWIFGDLCLMAAEFGNQDEIISQAMKITGQSKHLVLQAIRLCKFFPKEKRYSGWSCSHHTEILNLAGRFTENPEVMWKVVEQARKGTTTLTEAPDGTEIIHTEPVSCATLRAALQEASGQPLGPSKNYPAQKDRYLYFAMEDGLFRHDDLAVSKCDNSKFIVIDLKNMVTLGDGGAQDNFIPKAPDEWFVTLEPEEADEEVIEGDFVG